MTELKSVGEGLDSAFEQMRVLLANGIISKSPNGTAVLEKLTEFQSKMSETLFKKKSEEEGEKKPIKDTEAKKSSEKRKKNHKKKESDSDSDSEKDEPSRPTKKGAHATVSKLYSMDEMREIMKIGAECAKSTTHEAPSSNKKVCFNFSKGKCDRGSNCHYEHDKKGASTRRGICYNSLVKILSSFFFIEKSR
jgi:nucleolin